MFGTDGVPAALRITFFELAVAFAISVVIGLVVGLAVGLQPFARRSFMPIILLLYGTPQITILPLFILYFGIGPASKIAFGVTHGMFPIIVTIVAGVQNIKPILMTSARSMGASRWQVLRYVIFPHMIPSFFAGMRLGMTGVLLGVLLAELYVSTAGIGYFTTLFTQNFDPTKLLGLVAVLAAMAILLNEFVRRAEVHFAAGDKETRMSKLKLTVACGDYEIVRALKEGAVQADGIELVMLTGMGSRERHWRMARKHEFDVCEVNIGAYFMARDQGEPLTAIPVFLHRRFRHGFVFVNAKAGIREPKDLIGKKIGGTNFQPASNIWMRGILEEHYGVPHKSITWVVERSEDVPFTPPKDLRIEMIAPGKRLDVMLAEGEIPAMLSPDLPRLFLQGDKRIVRLFPNYKDIEIAYFRKTGIFPIMHVTAIKQEIVDKYPWVADQPGQGVRGGQGPRLSPHGQPARRAARLDQDRMGGAGGGARAGPVGLWPRRGQPQEPRDGAALHAPAGPDRPHDAAWGVIRRHRSGRRRRRGGKYLIAEFVRRSTDRLGPIRRHARFPCDFTASCCVPCEAGSSCLNAGTTTAIVPSRSHNPCPPRKTTPPSSISRPTIAGRWAC